MNEHKPSIFCPECGGGDVVYDGSPAKYLDYEQDPDGEIVIDDGTRLTKHTGVLDCLKCGEAFQPNELDWGPYLYLVGLDETNMWLNPVIEEHAQKLITVYLLDRGVRAYTCSLSPSYFLYPIAIQIAECDQTHEEEVAEAVHEAPLGRGDYHNTHRIEEIIKDDDKPSNFLGHCGHDHPDFEDLHDVAIHLHAPYFV